MKICLVCEKNLVKKIHKSGRLESDKFFEARIFCNKSCAVRYSNAARQGKVPRLPKVMKIAPMDVVPGINAARMAW
jgi:hypothetical protein